MSDLSTPHPDGFPPGHPMHRPVASAAPYPLDDQPPDGDDRLMGDDDEVLAPALPDEPPDAAALGVDVAGLPAARARLVRFAAWQRRTAGELDDLEHSRTAFLERMDVPTVTEAKLQALIERDTIGMLALIKGGGSITRDDARRFEREKLDQQLAGDRHEAEVVRGAMDALEQEIDACRAQLETMQRRRREYVLDAVTEHADGLAATYLHHVEAVHAALVPLLGLGTIVRQRGDYRSQYAPDECKVELPTFGLPALRDGVTPGMVRVRQAGYVRPPAVVVTVAEAKEAAVPWAALIETWMIDPTAKPKTMS